jgi:hypothetical protein
MAERTLVRVSPAEPHAGLALTADVQRIAGGLQVRYVLRGDLADLSVPAAATPPRRADGLWQDTCFELFFAAPGATTYHEVNLAPSGDWNVYRFTGYRHAGEPDPTLATLPFTVTRDRDGLRVAALVAAPSSLLEIGLTAIVRDRAGAISHWALHHAGDRPDFHRRESFVLRV